MVFIFAAKHHSNDSSPDVPKETTEKSSELPSFLEDVCVHFYNIPEDEKKKLTRFIIAYL